MVAKLIQELELDFSGGSRVVFFMLWLYQAQGISLYTLASLDLFLFLVHVHGQPSLLTP